MTKWVNFSLYLECLLTTTNFSACYLHMKLFLLSSHTPVNLLPRLFIPQLSKCGSFPFKCFICSSSFTEHLPFARISTVRPWSQASKSSRWLGLSLGNSPSQLWNQLLLEDPPHGVWGGRYKWTSNQALLQLSLYNFIFLLNNRTLFWDTSGMSWIE